MAAHAKSAEKRFVDMHPGLALELKSKLLDYVKLLQQARKVLPATAGETQIDTENGYPKVPQFDKITKEQAESLVRRYITAEYSAYRQCNV